MQLSANAIINMPPNKFALKVFNRLAYNRKLSSFLMASYLLGLLDHYILSDNVKSINLAIVWKYFLDFAQYIDNIRSIINNLLRLRY